jgi:hypothetical protein
MVPFWSAIQKNWCYIMHPDPMWPVNGVYRCPKCLNEYPVVWEQGLKRTPKPAMTFKEAPALVSPKQARSGLRMVKTFRQTA